jgi:hypothetical protein
MWGVALAFLLIAGVFCWLVVVPVWQVHAVLRKSRLPVKSDAVIKALGAAMDGRVSPERRDLVTKLGGPEAAAGKLCLYLRMPQRLFERLEAEPAKARIGARVLLLGACALCPPESRLGVVCRTEGETAQILNAEFAEAQLSSQLRPWGGMGVHVPEKPDESEIEWQQAASGGKVLILRELHRVTKEPRDKGASAFTQLDFDVPVDGRYFICVRVATWCCGCWLFAYRIDGGPVQVLGEEQNWRCFSADWDWWPVTVRKPAAKDGSSWPVPHPVALSRGRHTFEIVRVEACGNVALDQLAVARFDGLETRE